MIYDVRTGYIPPLSKKDGASTITNTPDVRHSICQKGRGALSKTIYRTTDSAELGIPRRSGIRRQGVLFLVFYPEPGSFHFDDLFLQYLLHQRVVVTGICKVHISFIVQPTELLNAVRQKRIQLQALWHFHGNNNSAFDNV